MEDEDELYWPYVDYDSGRAPQQLSAYENTRFFNKFSIKPQPPAVPDTQFTGSFGLLIYENIATALDTGTPGIKEQALHKLVNLLASPENIFHALKYGVFPQLVANISAKETSVRQLATTALARLTRNRQGRQHLISAQVLEPLSKQLHDDDAQVRLSTYAIFQNLVQEKKGFDQLIEFGALDTFIDKIDSEKKAPIKRAALDVIAKCLKPAAGHKFALEGGLVRTLVRLLTPEQDGAVLAAAAACMAAVAVPMHGKDKCVAAEAVPALLEIVRHDNKQTRAEAGHALMNITIAHGGKVAAIKAHAVTILLMSIFEPDDPYARMCAITALGNIAEHPDSRDSGELDQESTLMMLKDAAADDQPSMVKTAAKRTLGILTWRP